jgi:hypothetical protein
MINLKGLFGRKWLWLNFKVLYRQSPGETEENYEKLSQDSQSPGRDTRGNEAQFMIMLKNKGNDDNNNANIIYIILYYILHRLLGLHHVGL